MRALGPDGGVEPLDPETEEFCCEPPPVETTAGPVFGSALAEVDTGPESAVADTETRPFVSAPAEACTEAAGVETFTLTLPDPLEPEPAFALTEVEAAGAEALAATLVPLELELTLAWVEADGVEALTLAEATGDVGGGAG